MNCREFDADVVDLARAAELETAAAARLSEHLEQCAGCAARFARERQMTTALRAIADSAPRSSRAVAIEEQLLVAFAARQATAVREAPAPRQAFASPAARAWLLAAAVLVFAVAVWQGTARWRAAEALPPASTQTAASPAVSAPAVRPAGTPAPDRAGAAIRIPGDGIPSAVAPRARAARNHASPVPSASEDDVLRFVTLPTAVGLPALESGRIVRVELPTAMLPAYGLDVTPDSTAGVVEADVLVGQDGQARAIRFVTLNSAPRRRQ